MNCIYLRKRFKKYQPYFYCKYQDNEIILSACQNCLNRILKENKPISNKSIRLKKLESSRNNLKSKKGNCEYCGKYCENLDFHEVYGGSNRQRSIKNGFVIALCRNCHQDEKVLFELKIKFQKDFEKSHTRAEFIEIIGKSYIL